MLPYKSRNFGTKTDRFFKFDSYQGHKELGSRYPNWSDIETPFCDSLSQQILSKIDWISRALPLFQYRGTSVSEFGYQYPGVFVHLGPFKKPSEVLKFLILDIRNDQFFSSIRHMHECKTYMVRMAMQGTIFFFEIKNIYLFIGCLHQIENGE